LKRILFVIGTRPEIIKTAPAILAIKQDKRYKVGVCFTGQHKAMAIQMIKDFGITIDYDLKLMKSNQSLSYIASSAMSRLTDTYKDFKTDMVIVQGDTTTAFCAGLAAYYEKIEVAHIEAGLRTYDKYRPYPEELNRAMLSRIADIHFAPTKESKLNLIKENIPARQIVVTGNTAVDALLYMKDRVKSFTTKELKELPSGKKIVLVTAHRRENFGIPLNNICAALKTIAEKNPNILIIYPVHLNPNVLHAVEKILTGVKNVLLISPVKYRDFVKLMDISYLILTDSGGIQEEAPSLGKPVLILREKTERPEVVKSGCAEIVGTDKMKIVNACQKLLGSKSRYKNVAKKRNPVGDGKAAYRIKRMLDKFFYNEIYIQK